MNTFESPQTCEPFEIAETPDQTLIIVTRGTLVLSAFSSGAWHSARRTVGSVSLTPGGTRRRLRFKADSKTFETAQIFMPQELFSTAADELRRAGTTPRIEPPESISLSDPITAHLLLSLVRAYHTGDTEILAASIAQALAVRLLSLQNPGLDSENGRRGAGRLHGARLSELLNYMRDNCTRELSLDRLAAEAGFSRFHFVRSFKAEVGISPYRYLLNTRLETAAAMLHKTDSSVLEIASACGFSSATHLATSFKERFALTPSEHRRNRERALLSSVS